MNKICLYLYKVHGLVVQLQQQAETAVIERTKNPTQFRGFPALTLHLHLLHSQPKKVGNKPSSSISAFPVSSPRGAATI